MIDKSGIDDELELGDEAAYWIAVEELGALYSRERDRAWAVVIGCFAKMLERYPGGDGMPDEWRPHLDENGMWPYRPLAEGEE